MQEGPLPAEPVAAPPRSDINWVSYFVRGTLWSFAALLVYILATGPAVWLEMTHPATNPTIEAIYAPLSHLCDRYPTIQNALLWYLIKVWRAPIPVPHQ